ncbi:MAG TPA: transglycosylase domain-containing protein [Candidatus Cloacimonadota bacterium]|nr:transglycosylase domain-containing protein [Candidatus Cloacimonadota bacterium]
MQKSLVLIIIVLMFSPIFAKIEDPNIEYCSYALTADKTVVGYYGEKARIEVTNINQISKNVINALIDTEDKSFYSHDGVSYKGLGRAVAKTITGNVQGGSTITMQLARNLFLTQDRTISRKMAEMKIAREIEAKYSKNEILLMYLNTVYFGNSVYGIWAAADEYYSKTPDKLSIAESALLIGILNAPNAYNPVNHPDKAIARRNIVLSNMYDEKHITKTQFEQAKKEGLNLLLREKTNGFFLEYIRLQANQILKGYGKNLSSDIFIVETTLDSRAQRAAGTAMRTYWKEFPASMQNSQLGLISVDVKNGAIRAMIGGNPQAPHRGLNRSTQIRRQPGSAFKPMLYGCLLRDGFNLATSMNNMPLNTWVEEDIEWDVRNDDNSSSAAAPMFQALSKSLNLATAYGVIELASPDSVISFAKTCGIESNLSPFYSIALGTSEVSPLEMARAFAVFASGGYLSSTWSIVSIKDKNGKVYYRGSSTKEQVLDEETAYLMNFALTKAVNNGTGYNVRRQYKGVAAGKTGTTTNSTDAWFVGYNTELSTAIWVGNDTASKKLDPRFGYGGTACAPMFGIMYRELEKNKYPGMRRAFTQPEEIEFAEFCLESGMLATEECTQKELLPYNTNFPPDYCLVHRAEGVDIDQIDDDADDTEDVESLDLQEEGD